MKTVENCLLEDTLRDIAPKLEHVLINGPINPHIGDSSRYLDTALVRRSGTCQTASELLEMHLPSYGIGARLHVREIYAEHRSRERYLGGHVLLKLGSEDGRAIDPTWQQYFCLVGLTARKAQNDPSLEALYPEDKIGIIEPNSTEFADAVAEHAHELDTGDAVPRVKQENRLFRLLRDTTLDEKVSVYRNIWNLESYAPFSRRTRLQRELARSVALMEHM